VVVNGQRLAQERSINVRRKNIALVDAISADELGRLADKNLAENVEHLAGVSLKYDQGEGRNVSIRGIDGALNNVTVNGVDLGSPDGDTRQLPLDVFAGLLLSRVEVVKVITPDMDAQAIGGNINLVPASPFDYHKKKFLAASAQVGVHELNSTNPYAADLIAGAVFGDHQQFGIVAGVGTSVRDYRTYGIYPDDWSDVTGLDRGAPTNIKFTTYDLKRERNGAAATFAWRPTDGHEYSLQTLYSKFTEDEYRQRYRFDFGTLTASGDGHSATATGGTRRQDLRLEQKDKSVLNVTFNGEDHFGALKLDYQLSSGHNELDEPNYVWQFRSNGYSVSSNLDFGPFLYTVSPAQEVTPAQLQFFQVTRQANLAEEDINTVSLNATYNFGAEGSFFKTGLRVRDSQKVQDNTNDVYGRGTTANRFNLSQNDLLGDFTVTFIDDVALLNSPTIDQDAIIAYTNANLNGPTLVRNAITSQQNAILNDYTIDERVSAAYAMLNYDFGKLSVLAGVRFEKTEGSFKGFETRGITTATPTIVPVTVERDYSNTLPALIVKYDLSKSVILRAAYTETLSRPAYPQLTSGQNINEATSPVTISGGNPDLKPYISHNFDVAGEWYFAKGGLLSFGAFRKEINDPIFTKRVTANNVTFAGTTYASAVLVRPENAETSTLNGLEVAYQQQFRFLPGAWAGLGIAANVTLVDSEMKVPDRSDILTLPRQAGTIYSAQLFYQLYGIEAALSYHYTGDYLDTVGADSSQDTHFNRYRRLDAKISYAVNPHLSVFAEFQNLNDEALWEYQSPNPDRFIGYEKYGRTTYVGIKTKF
jgi:TonB-dependent receptor